MTRASLFLLPFLLVGCEFSDVDTGGDSESAPDLGGAYLVEVTEMTGCEAELDPVPFAGSLAVSGPAEALLFSWTEYTANAIVDTAFAVELAGSDEVAGGTLILEADGLASRDAGGSWVLDLGFSAELESADSAGGCTATGTLVATQESVR